MQQRREVGKLCDTVKTENLHNDAETHTSFREQHLYMLTGRMTSECVRAMEHLCLLLFTSAY